MKRLPLVLLLCFLFSRLSAQDSWTFRKTGKNIIAKNTATGKEKVVFKGEYTNTVDDGDSVETSQEFEIVSYVGPYLTVLSESYSYMQGAAHDSRERIFMVINANTDKPAKLTDLFSESDILKVLLQDKVVQEATPDGFTPKNLSDLLENLNNDEGVSRFGDYMLGSFAFHHMEPGKVAIRMGLSYNSEAARGAFTQLGFFLPLPEKLRIPFTIANKNRTLMKDLKPKIPQFQ